VTRPWEAELPRPWEAQQPIYIRTITIVRPNTQLGAGDQGYAGENTGSGDQTIATGVPASIQSSRERGQPLGKTPSDTETKSQWNIYIPLAAVSVGTILDRDEITDDLNRKFKVTAADPTSLGYRLRCEMLEA
jgi:hypothetical protein